MFKVNRAEVEVLTTVSSSKTDLGKSHVRLYEIFKQKIWNIIDIISQFSVYEMAHWINNIDRWIHNRAVDNKIEVI